MRDTELGELDQASDTQEKQHSTEKPENITEYWGNDELCYMGASGLTELISELKDNVSTVQLNGNHLHLLGTGGFAQVIRAFQETHVTTVVLSANGFIQLGAEGSAQVIAAFKGSKVNALDLSESCLSYLGAGGLAQLIRALEDTPITALYLRMNMLWQFELDGLVDIVKALWDTHVTTLDLSSNDLSSFGADGLDWLFGWLQASDVVTLDLSRNSLAKLDANGLYNILYPLSATMTTIHLGYNNLHNLGADGLAEVLDVFTYTDVKAISLNANGLHKLGVAGLVQIIKVLEETEIATINLRKNNLVELGVEGLLQVFAAFHGTPVTILELSGNGLNKLSSDDFIRLFASLPVQVKEVSFKYRHAPVEELWFERETINFPEFYLEHADHPACQAKLVAYLIQSVEEQLKSPEPINSITLPFDIDECLSRSLIPLLKEQQTGIAAILCEQLLLSRLAEHTYSAEEQKAMIWDVMACFFEPTVQGNPVLKTLATSILFSLSPLKHSLQLCDTSEAQSISPLSMTEKSTMTVGLAPSIESTSNDVAFEHSTSPPSFFSTSPLPKINKHDGFECHTQVCRMASAPY